FFGGGAGFQENTCDLAALQQNVVRPLVGYLHGWRNRTDCLPQRHRGQEADLRGLYGGAVGPEYLGKVEIAPRTVPISSETSASAPLFPGPDKSPRLGALLGQTPCLIHRRGDAVQRQQPVRRRQSWSVRAGRRAHRAATTKVSAAVTAPSTIGPGIRTKRVMMIVEIQSTPVISRGIG